MNFVTERNILKTVIALKYLSVVNKYHRQFFYPSPLLTHAQSKVYNNHPQDPKIVVVVDRWSLYRGHCCNTNSKRDPKKVVVVGRWPLFGGGRYSEVVVSSGLTVYKGMTSYKDDPQSHKCLLVFCKTRLTIKIPQQTLFRPTKMFFQISA